LQKNVQENKPKPDREIEVWADSFKEGEFILEQIKETFQNGNIVYEHGFLPTLEILINSKNIKFIVYGYYSSWDDIPIKISNLLEFGKPDGIIYEPNIDKIILSYEETSAVPTGNQSQQRLERVWYSAKESIPFVYLLGKCGLHKDGNIRTTSIWPSYLALKLSSQYCVPSLTLLYGSEKQPENYNIGNSLENIQEILQYYLVKEITNKSDRNKLEKILVNIFKNMGSFIVTQYKEISEHLPAAQLLTKNELHVYLAKRSVTNVTPKYSLFLLLNLDHAKISLVDLKSILQSNFNLEKGCWEFKSSHNKIQKTFHDQLKKIIRDEKNLSFTDQELIAKIYDEFEVWQVPSISFVRKEIQELRKN